MDCPGTSAGRVSRQSETVSSDPILLTCPPPSPSIRENRWANETDGFVLTAQPGRSQGRPPKTRAQSPSRKNRPAQPAFPKKPLSRSDDRKTRPGQQPSKRQFHGPICGSDDRATLDARWSSAASVSWTQNEALASVEGQHCRPRPLFVVAERFGGGRGDTLAHRA